MRPKQLLGFSFVLLANIATVSAHQPRRHIVMPMYAGFTIRQVNRSLNAFDEPEPLDGSHRTISRNAAGVEAMSVDMKTVPDVAENRTLFWPTQNINSIISDKWRVVQTTQALDMPQPHGFGVRSRLFHCEDLHPYVFTELFSGYVELHGVSFAHVIRTNSVRHEKIDAYYREEADCWLVQEITSRYAGDELVGSSGWELESIENGKADPALFEIPQDYREGSIREFRKEFVGDGPSPLGETPDPYERLKTTHPVP